MSLKTLQIAENARFVGREAEIEKLRAFSQLKEARILVVYGRRRVGKTELLEQFFRGRNLLKFEGLEQGDQTRQRQAFAAQLATYTGVTVSDDATRSWTALFTLLGEQVSTGPWTLYFEELQWMASYGEEFVAELKYAWDNIFRRNDNLILILCGSSPSFMKNKVVRSRSLYSRSMHEINLQPFSIQEARQFLGEKKSEQTVLDIYLTVGGIPEYLKYFRQAPGFELPLARESFVPGGYFISEYDRIFVSSLSDKHIYRRIVEELSLQPYSSRDELADKLDISGGGDLSQDLKDLADCGLIETYVPFNASARSKLVRYTLADNFLQFYAKFILPELKNISQGAYTASPAKGLRGAPLRQWLGYALERLCRNRHYLIADTLGFGSVKYRSGAFFKRDHLNKERGFQIDLIFDRKDGVATIVEVKYQATPVDVGIIEEVERKLEVLKSTKEIERVLIAPNGTTRALTERLYFDRVLGIEEMMRL